MMKWMGTLCLVACLAACSGDTLNGEGADSAVGVDTSALEDTSAQSDGANAGGDTQSAGAPDADLNAGDAADSGGLFAWDGTRIPA